MDKIISVINKLHSMLEEKCFRIKGEQDPLTWVKDGGQVLILSRGVAGISLTEGQDLNEDLKHPSRIWGKSIPG